MLYLIVKICRHEQDDKSSGTIQVIGGDNLSDLKGKVRDSIIIIVIVTITVPLVECADC